VSSGVVHWVAVIQDKIRLVSLGAEFWKAGWAWPQWLNLLGTFAAVNNGAHPWALICWQYHEVMAKMISILPAHILGKLLLTLSYISSDAMPIYSPTMSLNNDPQNEKTRTGCKLNECTKASLLSSQFYNHVESQCGL